MSSFESPVKNDSGQCPHFDEVDETTLRRLFSKVAAVRSEDYELFSFTHRPMEVFRGTSTQNAQTWTEDRIYREFSEDRIGNFSVVIEGEVGTGKSELCAYLSHRLRLDGRPILHIDKDDDLMSILSERIPEFYMEHFGEELPGASEFKNLRDDIQHNPQTVANNATSGAILNLRRQGYEVRTTPEQENEIRDFIADKLVQLVERGQYDRKVQFVGDKEFEQNEFLQVFVELDETEDAISAFNNELWREIRSRYDTASLDDVLEQVGDRFEDTRPVLVFEDFSIAAMEAKKLRNYMERDKGTDNWDFIVAGTRDSTEILHKRTAEDRFEFFQTNEQGSNSVLFLNEGTAVDFVRPYLGYIKSHDDSVQYDRDGENFDLKPAPAGTICDQCGFCDESFRDLFPFNEQFLQRIYGELDESEKSPREFIMTVFDALRDFYDGFVEAPSSADVLTEMDPGLNLADEVFDEAAVYADLASWYGTDEGTHVTVDRKFVDAFGLTTERLPSSITVNSTEVRISKEGDGPTPGTGPDPDPECPSCGSTSLLSHSDGRITCESCGEEISGPDNPVEAKIKEHKQQVGAWLTNPQKCPETNMYIRRGLRDLLKKLTDDFRLYEGQPLRYNLSSQKDPFVYPDSNTAPNWDQILLDREDFHRSDLRQLVEFGVRRVEQPRSANYEKIYDRNGTQLTGYAMKWRRRIFETQLESDDVLYKRRAQFDFKDFLLASYAALCLLDDPTKPVDAKRINAQYQASEDLSIDSNLSSALHDVLTDDEYAYLPEAMKDAPYVESLVGELFGVSGNALDVPRVRQNLETSPPAEVLDSLGRGYIQNIEARVRFETGHNVKDFADTMYDVWGAFEEVVEHGYDEETVEYVTSTVAGTDMNEIKDRYDSLKTYDSVDPKFLEALGKVCRHSNQDIEQTSETAKLAAELRSGNTLEQITSALASRKLSNSPVVERFKQVPFAGKSGSSVGSMGKSFKRVSNHYVD